MATALPKFTSSVGILPTGSVPTVTSSILKGGITDARPIVANHGEAVVPIWCCHNSAGADAIGVRFPVGGDVQEIVDGHGAVFVGFSDGE